MNFLVDAHLPRRLCHRLRNAGHDAVHTLDLPHGNRTTDAEINQRSVQEQRVVVTKDADFVESLIIQGVPYKLLLIATGNIRNSELEQLLTTHLDTIVAGFATSDFIEIDQTALQFH